MIAVIKSFLWISYLLYIILVHLQGLLAVGEGIAGLLAQLRQQGLIRGLPEQAICVNEAEYLWWDHLEYDICLLVNLRC